MTVEGKVNCFPVSAARKIMLIALVVPFTPLFLLASFDRLSLFVRFHLALLKSLSLLICWLFFAVSLSIDSFDFEPHFLL